MGLDIYAKWWKFCIYIAQEFFLTSLANLSLLLFCSFAPPFLALFLKREYRWGRSRRDKCAFEWGHVWGAWSWHSTWSSSSRATGDGFPSHAFPFVLRSVTPHSITQIISDFFFPSELHDALSFDQFRSCVPSARLQEAGAGGQDGLLAKLYEGFLFHRQQARESVRESIDVSAVETDRETDTKSVN